MHEVRTKFLYQVQGQADFQHCEVLKVIRLTVMTVCDDRRLSIEILGAVGTPSIRIIGLTLCLLYGSLCLVGLNPYLARSHTGSSVREPVKIRELVRPVRERAKFVYRSEHI